MDFKIEDIVEATNKNRYYITGQNVGFTGKVKSIYSKDRINIEVITHRDTYRIGGTHDVDSKEFKLLGSEEPVVASDSYILI